MKNSSELPEQTRIMAEKIFASITKGFSR